MAYQTFLGQVARSLAHGPTRNTPTASPASASTSPVPPATGGWAELDGLATTPPCDDPRGWARRLAHLDVDPRHCHAEADPFTQRVRAAEIMDNPLQAISHVRARFAILDMTDVELIDTSTASHLPGLVRAIQLLGS